MNAKHHKTRIFLLGTTVCTLLLGGCSGVKDSLGITKDSPDEFTIIKRAPLEIPAGIALPPPTPGAPRPQEQAPNVQAKQAVFGQESSATTQTSQGEQTLLERTQANQIDPNIRYTIDAEAAAIAEREKPVAQKLLGIVKETPAPASVVDAKKEAERIKKNTEEGKPINEGETPVLKE